MIILFDQWTVQNVMLSEEVLETRIDEVEEWRDQDGNSMGMRATGNALRLIMPEEVGMALCIDLAQCMGKIPKDQEFKTADVLDMKKELAKKQRLDKARKKGSRR